MTVIREVVVVVLWLGVKGREGKEWGAGWSEVIDKRNSIAE